MSNDDSPTTADVLTQVISLFQKLDESERRRLLETVGTFFQLDTRPVSRTSPSEPSSTFSENRDISPKDFLFEKKPVTDVERVACLAYYLTHYRGLPHFRTLDLSKLNTEAAQLKFSNAAWAVDNALKQSYLVAATRGQKQLSAAGEQFVRLLPDRAAAKTAMTHFRPRRRIRRSAPPAEAS